MDDPSVTMNESISSNVTERPLIRPMNSPMARTTTIAGKSDQPWRTCRIASTIDDSDRTAAIDRSKSPLVSGTIRPSARISRTACDPKIVWKLPDVAYVSGLRMQNTMTTTSHARMSAYFWKATATARLLSRGGRLRSGVCAAGSAAGW